jgi:cytochrome c5
VRIFDKKLWNTVVLVAAVMTVGCQTTEQMAPPVTPSFVANLGDANMETGHLEQGRHTYVTMCARCHNIEPITRYSVEQWPKIVDRMSKKAHLQNEQESDLLKYILAARKIIDTSPRIIDNETRTETN